MTRLRGLLAVSALVVLGAFAFHSPAARAAATRTSDCFPHLLECGYPNQLNTGVADCSALPTFALSDLPADDYYYSGSGNVVDIYGNNVTIQGYNIGDWQFNLSSAQGTTFNDDCLSTNGETGQLNAINATNGGSGIAGHTTVTNSTITGEGCPIFGSKLPCISPGVVQQLVAGGPNSFYDNDLLVGAVEPVGLSSGSTLENSYVSANGYAPGAHTEDTYSLPGVQNITISDDTLLNPSYETANVFIDNGTGPCTSSAVNIDGNFMAGGGFTIYGCSGETSDAGTFSFTDNRIARCDGTPITHDYPGLGGDTCGPTAPSASTDDTALGAGQDFNGYWPAGGYFGTFAYLPCTAPGMTFSGNEWDDTNAPIACE